MDIEMNEENRPSDNEKIMNPRRVRLFVKTFCGWCHEAKDWLDDHEISYEEIDVNQSADGYAEMIRISEQKFAPVIEVDGEILADFDVDQLEEFWNELEKNSP